MFVFVFVCVKHTIHYDTLFRYVVVIFRAVPAQISVYIDACCCPSSPSHLWAPEEQSQGSTDSWLEIPNA